MARWAEALDAQLDCYRFYSGERGHGHAKAFSDRVASDEDIGTQWGRPGSLFHRFDERLETALFNADPVYVDPDMMTVFEAAQKNFHVEPLEPTDLVTTSGFLLLPRPVAVRDIHDKTTTFRAVMWEPVEMRKRIHVEGAEFASEGRDFKDTEPRGGIILYLFHALDDVDDYTIPGARGVTPFIVSHVMPWTFGELDVDVEDERSIVRPIQCLWRLMMQTLAVHTAEKAGGPYGKRWAKAKMPEKKVTVVRLRRTYEDKNHGDEEPGSVEWTHRWLVGGHWRNQWYPGAQLHRQIWISPYAKGPVGLPLVINKTRVFEFVR